MAPIWLLIIHLYMIDSAQAVNVSEASFVSVESGKNVTLHCKFVEKSPKSIWVWYKQRAGQEPQAVVVKLPEKIPGTSSNRFNISDSFSLTINQTTKDDEGMYFCGEGDKNTITFSNGTFLAVAGQPQVNISVLQTPVLGSVDPGESVTLQCTVLSEIRAAEPRVLWFRAAAGQSSPEIIYTHHSHSRQCEISTSTCSSVYNFSMSNFSHSDVGTYYCAVAACGKIIVGNGASVHFATPVNPIVFYLAAALGICVIVICTQAFRNYSVRECDLEVENKTSQDSAAAVELNYAAKSLRKKSGRSGDSVYSEVRYFSVTDPNNQ